MAGNLPDSNPPTYSTVTDDFYHPPIYYIPVRLNIRTGGIQQWETDTDHSEPGDSE